MTTSAPITPSFIILALCGALTLSATACQPSEGSDAESAAQKGEEEGPLETGDSGKLDSFRQPTEHGKVYPGESARVYFRDGELYHAWTFDLKDAADIIVETEVSDNLDTVMYLYYREDSTQSWGSYLAKNDDYRGELRSRIEKRGAAAGEYRVIVKPHKTALRGPLTFLYGCDGAGCESRFDAAKACTQDRFASTHYKVTPSCLRAMDEVLSAPLQEFANAPDCALDKVRNEYYNYWSSYIDWEDSYGNDPIEDVIELDIKVYGESGYLISASAGGDEDSIVYLMNAQSEILAYVNDGQSPYGEWSCGDASESELTQENYPDEYCLLDIMYSFDFTKKDLVDEVETTADQADLPLAIKAAVDYAEKNLGVDPQDLELHYELYDVYNGSSFVAHTILGDPMEPESFSIYTTHPYGTTTNVLYLRNSDGHVMSICEENN